MVLEFVLRAFLLIMFMRKMMQQSSQAKIYVGNLPYSTDNDDLESHFKQYGEISEVKLIMDRETGRSKGFAFITFADQQSAQASLASNETEFQGRKIKVNIAKDDNTRSSGGGAGGGFRRGGNGGGGGGGGGNNRNFRRDRDQRDQW